MFIYFRFKRSWWPIASLKDLLVTGPARIVGDLNCSSNITGAKVYNAVWNDYAELFKNNGPIEVGKIAYTGEDGLVRPHGEPHTAVGVVSDTYGHLLGGVGNMHDSDYSPIGLAGRVPVYAPGVQLGDFIAANNDGSGRIADLDKDKGCILGKCVGPDPQNRKDYVYMLISIS